MTTPTPPFKVGDRVRRKKPYRSDVRYEKAVIVGGIAYVEVVYDDSGGKHGGYWWFTIHPVGCKRVKNSRSTLWEPETDPEILRDHNADLLIKAYQEGDKTALRPLIDRLLELL